MATFMNFDKKNEEVKNKKNDFDLDATLQRNAWCPHLEPCQAEKILSGQPVYTYVLRPNINGRGFSISFVQKNGTIKHDNFTLIDPIHGIWRNAISSHVGKLEKVICDMMECTPFDLKPL